jgi:hypothetical protein
MAAGDPLRLHGSHLLNIDARLAALVDLAGLGLGPCPQTGVPPRIAGAAMAKLSARSVVSPAQFEDKTQEIKIALAFGAP